jgi:hypothetical protein
MDFDDWMLASVAALAIALIGWAAFAVDRRDRIERRAVQKRWEEHTGGD